MPNLGAYYLCSFLRRRALHVELINFFNAEQDLFRAMLAESPSAVAITTTFYFEAAPIVDIVQFVRRHSPTTKVIVGGPHIYNVCTDNAAAMQDDLFSEMGADIYIADSQGELTLSRVCQALRDGDDRLTDIPNVIYACDGSRFSRTARAPEHNDMNDNVVDWRLFDPKVLTPTVQTRTARSCAYKCAFCRYPVMAGTLDLVDVAVVERELQYLSSIGVTDLLFIDDTFNIPLNRFKELCRMMIKNRFGFRWFSYFRCANADSESFDLMAAAGCTGVFLGIESGDDRILKAMNKIATVHKYSNGIAQLRARNILTYASFIIGHPGETEETARNTIAFIDDAQPSFYCMETFFFDPKVPIAARAADYQLVGGGYAWSHGSMDWRQASALVEQGYRRITGSIVVPLYSFDLWSVAYLMGQGMSTDQIRRFLKVAASMLVKGLDAVGTGDPKLDTKLIDVFRDVPASVSCA
jgi:p-methyltransferase